MELTQALRLFKRLRTLLVISVAFCAGAASSQASLIGTTVNGGMFFHDLPGENDFDPSSDGSGTTAVIGANSPTFSTAVDGDDFNLSADFSASQLDISFAPYREGGAFEGFLLTFQDTAFNGLALSLLSFGGPFSSTSDFSYSLVGDTISFNVIDELPVTGLNDPYTASFSLASATVPEPSPVTLVLIGLCATILGGATRGSAKEGSPGLRK